MRNFSDTEFDCNVVFDNSGPFWHIYTPEDNPIIFSNSSEFMEGMNIVGICAKLCTQVSILTFELMSNHMHYTVAGAEDDVNSFYSVLKHCITNWLEGKGRISNTNNWTSPPRRIKDLNDLRNVIAYNNRNGFLVSPEHTPFSYPWGANRYFFNPEAKLRFSRSSEKSFMSMRARRQLIHSHIVDCVTGPVLMDGYACPLDFCDVAAAEKLFRNASHYLSLITRNVESQKAIAAEIGERVFYNDDELFKVVCSLTKKVSSQSSPAVLSKEEKLSIANTLHHDYNASNKQISRMLRLDISIVNSIYPPARDH